MKRISKRARSDEKTEIALDTSPSYQINKLIDRLKYYENKWNDEKDQQEAAEQIIAIGQTVLPELFRAFHDRNSCTQLIAKAIVEIAINENDPLVKDRISQQIIDEMAVHAKWHITTSVLDRERYRKDFDETLFHKACEAALALGALKDSRALPHLFQIIQNEHTHPTVSENALIALGQIGDEQAITNLIELIDKHNFNTHFAIDALVKMGSIAAVPPLLNCLENVSGLDIDDTRANIIWALGQIRDPRAAPKLIEWINTHKDDMRAVAIQALGNIGHPSAIPVLETCLSDFTVLHRQDWGGTFWLFRTFRERRVCDFAVEALQQIGTPEALDIILKWRSPST